MSGTQDPTLRRPPPSGPPPDLPEGMEVGEYRVQRKIGEGGMGAVYAAVHPIIGKQVAIKVLAPHLASRPDLVDRFVSEARAVNRIGHPNIVDIFSFGWLPGDRHYFVMEYLQGQSLHDWMKKPLDIPEARRVLGQVCGALEAAHRTGIVHRDLKPDNIWIAQPRHGDSFAKLLDFGIAKLMEETDSPRTQTGMIMGTPAYMSPEQCHGQAVDSRADIYSLGVILYELFVGRLPFEGSFAALFAQHLTAIPQPPSRFVTLPPGLDRLILSCLEKSPEHRPRSAAALAAALDDGLAAMTEAPVRTVPPGAGQGGAGAGGLPATSELPGPAQPISEILAPTSEVPLSPSPGARKARIAALVAVGLGAALLLGAIVMRKPEGDGAAAGGDAVKGAAGAAAAGPAGEGATARVRVVIQGGDAARVLIDGRVVAAGVREADVPNVAADRQHVLRVEAAGKPPHERRFAVAAGAVVELQVALGAGGEATAAVAAPATIVKPPAPASKPVAPPAATTTERPHRPATTTPGPRGPVPGRHRDGLVGDDIFDK